MKKLLTIFTPLLLLTIFATPTHAASHSDDMLLPNNSMREFNARKATVYVKNKSLKPAAVKALKIWKPYFDFKLVKHPSKTQRTIVISQVNPKKDKLMRKNENVQAYETPHADYLTIKVAPKRLFYEPNLYYVIAHELGHALGLGHDYTNEHSIMVPTIDDGKFSFTPAVVNVIDKIYAN